MVNTLAFPIDRLLDEVRQDLERLVANKKPALSDDEQEEMLRALLEFIFTLSRGKAWTFGPTLLSVAKQTGLSPRVRIWAAAAVARMHFEADGSVAVIGSYLNAEVEEMACFAALEAMGTLGALSQPWISQVADLLFAGNCRLQLRAAECLRQLGIFAEGAKLLIEIRLGSDPPGSLRSVLEDVLKAIRTERYKSFGLDYPPTLSDVALGLGLELPEDSETLWGPLVQKEFLLGLFKKATRPNADLILAGAQVLLDVTKNDPSVLLGAIEQESKPYALAVIFKSFTLTAKGGGHLPTEAVFRLLDYVKFGSKAGNPEYPSSLVIQEYAEEAIKSLGERVVPTLISAAGMHSEKRMPALHLLTELRKEAPICQPL